MLCNFVLHPCYKQRNPKSHIELELRPKKRKEKITWSLRVVSWDYPFHLPRESHISLQSIVHAKRKKKPFYFTKKTTLIIYFTFLYYYFYNTLYIIFFFYILQYIKVNYYYFNVKVRKNKKIESDTKEEWKNRRGIKSFCMLLECLSHAVSFGVLTHRGFLCNFNE